MNSTLDTSGDGSICTLRDALTTANNLNTPVGNCLPGSDSTPETEIYFSLGNSPVKTIELSSTLPTITAGVTISGPSMDELIIRRVSTSPKFRLLDIQSTESVTVGGVTLSGGDANTADGGAIRTGGSGSLTIQYTTISGNTAWRGGGIYANGGGALTIVGSVISGNTATVDRGTEGGGGLASVGGNTTVTESTFSENNATADGGGISSLTGALTVTSSTFSGNATYQYGGGISSVTDTLTVTDSTFNDNIARYGGGGGIATSNSLNNIPQSTLTVTGSTFNANSGANGGGISTGSTALNITGSTFSNNTVTSFGGGITASAPATVTNSTIANNTAGTPNDPNSGIGGGIFLASGADNHLTLTNVTLGGNSAAEGGGLYLNTSSGATLTNTIVAASHGDPCLLMADSSVTDNGGNLDQGTTCGFTAASSRSNADPLLGPLQDNGGPTLTMLPGTGSPAIDAGLPATCAATGPTQPNGLDQRGAARPMNSCDSGAVEAFAIVPTALPSASIGLPYSQQLSAGGGGTAPYSFAVTAGSLPAGLTLSPAGALTGMPSAAGSFAFTITATDTFGFGTAQPYTITAVKQPAALALSGLGTFTFDGQPHAATATTGPADLATVTITYTDTATNAVSATPPTNIGNYAVTATLDNATYAAAPVTGTISIVATAPITHTIAATVVGAGTINPAGTTTYTAGTAATYVATAAGGQTFTGWTLDGQYVGYANPLMLTVDNNRTLIATFVTTPQFSDLGTLSAEDQQAITFLAALGIINPTGVNGSGEFQPDAAVNRAQVAAFIARTFGWQREFHRNGFPDKCDAQGNCIDDELWNNVAALADYGVVGGYTDSATCASADTTAPCYLPRDTVNRLQVVSIVARAFTQTPNLRPTGFWERQAATASQYTNVPDSGTQRSDLATYHANAGAIPGQADDGTFPDPTGPASRRFIIEVLWQAYSAQFGVDRVP